jgi:hypothetical protein
MAMELVASTRRNDNRLHSHDARWILFKRHLEIGRWLEPETLLRRLRPCDRSHHAGRRKDGGDYHLFHQTLPWFSARPNGSNSTISAKANPVNELTRPR